MAGLAAHLDRRSIIAAGVIAAAGLSACSVFPSYKVHYSLTLNVSVGGKLLSASNVMETRYYKNHVLVGFDAIYPYSSRTVANALKIPVGEHGVLFGLLGYVNGQRDGFPAGAPLRALNSLPKLPPAHRYPEDSLADTMEPWENFSGELKVEDRFLPALFWMPEQNELKAGQFLTTGSSSPDGGGKIDHVSATIIKSNEPISQGLEKTLPWWNDVVNPGSSDPTFRSNPFDLRHKNFVIG